MLTPIQLVNVREDASYREWLRHVYPFYLHDLLQFEQNEYHLSASVYGSQITFPTGSPRVLPPFVVLSGTVPVGFAFIGQVPFPFMSEDVQFRLSEFFVLRAYRRSGIGPSTGTCRPGAVLSGSFELTVLAANATRTSLLAGRSSSG